MSEEQYPKYDPLAELPPIGELDIDDLTLECKRELDSNTTYLNDEEKALVDKAFVQAFICHYYDKRKSNEPYIIHPVHVANNLATWKMDAVTICAGLLHDVVEDAKSNKDPLRDTIKERFGEEVLYIVEGCSKITKMDMGASVKEGDDAKEQIMQGTLRKLLVHMLNNYKVVLVKIADRMHNMETIEFMSPAKRREKSLETLRIYAPLAVRFGMDSIAEKLQDMAFKHVYPYRERIIREKSEELRAEMKDQIEEIRNVICKGLADKGIEVVDFVPKMKIPYRIYDKMRSKKIPFNAVKNYLSFVIVLKNIDDCYSALGVVHNHYRPKIRGINDYIHSPLSTGYQSIHTTVNLDDTKEVKFYIRTEKMNLRARQGILALNVYETEKKNRNLIQEEVKMFFGAVARLREEANDPEEFYNMALNTLDDRQIVVLDGSSGDFISIPANSTVLDYAYRLSYDLGNHCYGAFVNNKGVGVDYVLQHTDTIRVLQGGDMQVESSWLDIVTTNLAKKGIKEALSNKDVETSIQTGRLNLLTYIEFEDGHTERIDDVVEKYVKRAGKYANKEDFLHDLGVRRISPLAIATDIVKTLGKEEHLKMGDKKFIVRDSNVNTIKFEDRNRPIPGDPIKAVFGSDNRVKICREDSPTLKRSNIIIVDAEWGEFDSRNRFKSDVRIIAEDAPGLLKKLVDVIATHGCNIRFCETKAVEGGGPNQEVFFCLDVTGRELIESMRDDFKCIPEVRTVSRL